MSDGSDRLRVLVVGCGLIGRQRIEAIATLPDACLAGTVDPAAPEPLQDSGVSHHKDLSEVDRDAYDAAIIAVPHDLSGDLAAAVLRAGKPVLIEKPLGVTAVQAGHLERMAASLTKPSFVGYNYRFLPAIRRMLEILSVRRLGRLRNVDLFLGHGGHPKSDEGWKLDPARAGGGVLLDPGVHLLDLMLLMAPGVECSDIQATRGFWRTGIEEDLVATFRLDQLLVTVRVSHIRWVNTFRVEAMGEEGYAIAEGRGGTYGDMRLAIGRRWAWSRPGAVSQRETEETDDFGAENVSLREELGAVVEVWRTGVPRETPVHPATMAEARAVTELCERLYGRLR